MNELFCHLGDLADKLTAHPIFLTAFNLALGVLWLSLGTDVANIFISIITAEIVLISAGANRRGQIAQQAKLDEIIHALSDARDDLVHAEDKSEQEIKKLREEV